MATNKINSKLSSLEHPFRSGVSLINAGITKGLDYFSKDSVTKDKSFKDIYRMSQHVQGVPGYKKGGRVKKTGVALVHKGEVVIPKKVAKKMTYAQVAKSVRKTMGYK